MIQRTLVLMLIATVSGGAVLGWRYRTRPPVRDSSEVLQTVRKTSGHRTANRIALKIEGGGYRLHSGRAGTDGSRQLLYHRGKAIISIFVSAQTVRELVPSPGWTLDPLRPGQPAWRYAHADGRRALAWLQNGHRCIATADTAAGSLTEIVRALTE